MGFDPVHVRTRFDGHTFVPETPVDVPEGTILQGWIEPQVVSKEWVRPGPGEPRKPGSAKGLVWMSDDFDDPLEDFAEYV